MVNAAHETSVGKYAQQSASDKYVAYSQEGSSKIVIRKAVDEPDIFAVVMINISSNGGGEEMKVLEEIESGPTMAVGAFLRIVSQRKYKIS